ncbi:MAG: hypothetical protein HZB65_02330 [Candidatus Aenigmarchaeota archaeon]|nr:hypothetical protein [Candidatus Aenigmarchaeota archaeon]
MAEPVEKVFNIPIGETRKKCRMRRSNYAMALIKEYLKLHTKKKTIKIGRHLNSLVWTRGPKKPQTMVRVKAVIADDVVKAEILGRDYQDFVAMKVRKKEKLLDQLKARMGAKAMQKAEEEKKIEGDAKTSAEAPKLNTADTKSRTVEA